jgi:cytochrome P450
MPSRHIETPFLPVGDRLTVSLTPQTIVSLQSYTTHRDPSAFPDGDKYDPSRWLTTEGGTDDMKELFMPFGKGRRGCMGMNLATMEMKLAIATLFKRYTVKVSEQMKEDDMDIIDRFAITPKGRHCLLSFSRLTESD